MWFVAIVWALMDGGQSSFADRSFMSLTEPSNLLLISLSWSAYHKVIMEECDLYELWLIGRAGQESKAGLEGKVRRNDVCERQCNNPVFFCATTWYCFPHEVAETCEWCGAFIVSLCYPYVLLTNVLETFVFNFPQSLSTSPTNTKSLGPNVDNGVERNFNRMANRSNQSHTALKETISIT